MTHERSKIIVAGLCAMFGAVAGNLIGYAFGLADPIPYLGPGAIGAGVGVFIGQLVGARLGRR